MASDFFAVDSSGAALRKGRHGIGFRLAPGVPPDAADTARVGAFPVTVTPRRLHGGKGEPLTVINGDSFWFDDSDAFESLDVAGAPGSSCWVLYTFSSRAAGMVPTSGKARRTAKVTFTTVPTAAPSVAGDGIPVTEATKGFNLAVTSGLSIPLVVWQRMRGGAWVADTVNTYTPSTDGPLLYRDVLAGAAEFYLQASSGAAVVAAELNVVEEVG